MYASMGFDNDVEAQKMVARADQPYRAVPSLGVFFAATSEGGKSTESVLQISIVEGNGGFKDAETARTAVFIEVV
jgi:hypothetical protein